MREWWSRVSVFGCSGMFVVVSVRVAASAAAAAARLLRVHSGSGDRDSGSGEGEDRHRSRHTRRRREHQRGRWGMVFGVSMLVSSVCAVSFFLLLPFRLVVGLGVSESDFSFFASPLSISSLAATCALVGVRSVNRHAEAVWSV